MTDNIDVQPGERAGKVAVATDDIGGVHFPIYKLAYGADGEQTSVSPVFPLPIDCFQLAMGPIYNDGTYKYYGEALPGTLVGASSWRISRMNITTKQVDWADGNADFDNPYTDENTVTVVQTYS
jgi:hypothetical protein